MIMPYSVRERKDHFDETQKNILQILLQHSTGTWWKVHLNKSKWASRRQLRQNIIHVRLRGKEIILFQADLVLVIRLYTKYCSHCTQTSNLCASGA